jgi:hypothetical protein
MIIKNVGVLLEIVSLTLTFRYATFNDSAYFTNATFDDEFNFRDTTFDDRVSFRDVHIKSGSMKKAKFTKCDLRGATIDNVNLNGTDFRGSTLMNVDFGQVNIDDNTRFLGSPEETEKRYEYRDPSGSYISSIKKLIEFSGSKCGDDPFVDFYNNGGFFDDEEKIEIPQLLDYLNILIQLQVGM